MELRERSSLTILSKVTRSAWVTDAGVRLDARHSVEQSYPGSVPPKKELATQLYRVYIQ
jgi:hypothetical protein